MKLIPSLCALLAFAACKPRQPPTEQERQQAEQARRQEIRSWADDLAGRLRYFRDRRSGLCFAYMYVSYGVQESATGGPAITEIDCAKIEKLLVNADVPPPQAEHPIETTTAP